MNWLVLGAGVSGTGAAKLLRKLSHEVRVSDGGVVSSEKRTLFKDLGVQLLDGGHDLSHLDDIDKMVLSPGMGESHPLIVHAKKLGIPIISEVDLALEKFKGQIIAVSGTNGKSTVCAMLHHMLGSLGHKSTIGGNFGDPPSALIAENRIEDILVLELSSYQLEQSKKIRPTAAILTSFSVDHLARHKTMEGYLRAKWKIFENMTKNSSAVMTSQISELAKELAPIKPVKNVFYNKYNDFQMHSDSSNGYFVSDKLLTSEGLEVDLGATGITLAHNLLNVGFAAIALKSLFPTTSIEEIVASAGGYRGLAHRCELLGLCGGKPVINDSKSTNVESVLVALESQSEPVILLIGGQGKDEDYSEILTKKDKIAVAVAFGASGKEIHEKIKGGVPSVLHQTLAAALDDLENISKTAKAPILLSPGCASFDEFKNFEARGDFFRSKIEKILDT